MGYWTWALIVMLLNVGLIAFFVMANFKEIMDFMKTENLGYDRYDDRRSIWLIGTGLISFVLSFLVWPVMVVVWGVGFAYMYLKGQDKFKRIMDIINEKTPPENTEQ